MLVIVLAVVDGESQALQAYLRTNASLSSVLCPAVFCLRQMAPNVRIVTQYKRTYVGTVL